MIIVPKPTGISKAQAFDAAAGVIARSVPDAAGVADLLEIAGQTRLARAVRQRATKTPAADGRPKPNANLWAAAAAGEGWR